MGSLAPVAQQKQEPIENPITNLCNNPQYYKDIVNELLYNIITRSKKYTPIQTYKLLKKINDTQLLKPPTLAIYSYFLQEKASTRQRIREELDMPEQTVYTYTDILVKHGFIKKVTKLKGPHSGGQRVQLYSLMEASSDDIVNAVHKETQRNLPAYNYCREVTQYILDEWLPAAASPEEIRMVDILRIVDKYRVKGYGGFNKGDISHVTAKLLHEHGVKVWR